MELLSSTTRVSCRLADRLRCARSFRSASALERERIEEKGRPWVAPWVGIFEAIACSEVSGAKMVSRGHWAHARKKLISESASNDLQFTRLHEQIHQRIVQQATEAAIIAGKKLRTDTTAVETLQIP